MHYQRWQDHGTTEKLVGGWHGDAVGVRGQHYRVVKAKGKASEYVCPCGKTAQGWAYQHDCVDERLWPVRNKTRAFCLHIEHYVALCRSCHVRYDRDDEWCANLADSLRGKPNHGSHVRWHVNRGLVNPACAFC